MTSDELDPPLAPRALTESERAVRSSAERIDTELETLVRPRIAAHISASRQALDVIESELDWLTETFSIDPLAQTRAAALWLLMGRCVGQQRAVLLLVEHGMAVEGRPLDRTVKEISNIVKAMAADGQPAERLARQWLSDGEAYVKAQAARRGMVLPFQNRDKESQAFQHLGVNGLDAADKKVYDDLSRAAHGRRSSVIESYYAQSRHMARGSRYALLDQAVAVEWSTSTTSGVVLTAAAMLLPFRGHQHIVDHVLCLCTALDAIRKSQRLDAATILQEARISRYPIWPPG